MMAFYRRLLLVLFIAAVAAIKIDADRAIEMQAPFLSLYMAAEEGRLDVVRALVASSDVAVDEAVERTGFFLEDGRTPLYIAAQFGHLEVVRVLVDAGATVNQVTKVGAGSFKKLVSESTNQPL